jgi:excisionase family DNA binding protein
MKPGRSLSRCPEVLSVEEAAAVLRVGRDRAYAMCHAGEIPCLKIRKQFRIPKEALRRFLAGEAVPGYPDLGSEPAAEALG